MEDEVKKHVDKIHKAVKNPNHTIREKIVEVAIEVCIIIFAITVSIWLHGWSEHRHQQEEVKVFLKNMKDDISQDIKKFNEGKDSFVEMGKEYNNIINLKSYQFDSLARSNKTVYFPFHSASKKINEGNYEGFKTSGKIGYIENEKLKKLILSYYQESLLAVVEVDNYYNQYLFRMFDFKIKNGGKSEKEIYSNPEFRELLKLLIFLGQNDARVYDEIGITIAKQIIEEIDKENNQ